MARVELMNRPDKRRTCASCLARIRFAEPNKQGSWTTISMPSIAFLQLRAAATEFDGLTADSDEPVTVVDFINWLAPSIPGSTRYLAHDVPEMEGQSRTEGANKAGVKPTRHGNPDPLPFLDRRRVA